MANYGGFTWIIWSKEVSRLWIYAKGADLIRAEMEDWQSRERYKQKIQI
jgi:hypothetical protein